jgi:hypothetical protein
MRRWEQRDGAIAAGMFATTTTLAWLVRSRLAYYWDSAEFAQAISTYDLSISQPHQPGYFLYVMIGRLINGVVGDPHTSLVCLSGVCGGGLAAVMFLLGRELFGRSCGVAAGLLTMTSPVIWFFSAVALTYVVDSFLVGAFVLWAWLAMRRGGRWADVVGLAVLLGVITGVRQQTVPGLLPVTVYVFWKFQSERLKKTFAAAVVLGVVVAAGAIPMFAMCGGWHEYWQIFHRFRTAMMPFMLMGGGVNAVVWSVFFLGLFCANGLMLGVVPLAGGIVSRGAFLDPQKRREYGPALTFLLAWVLPAIAASVCIGYVAQPGHIVGFLPGLILAVALVATELKPRWLSGGAVAVLVAGNVFGFLAWPAGWDGVFFHTGCTARTLRVHDHDLSQAVAAIRDHFKPSEVVVYHAASWLPLGFRHFAYYLPEFDQYQLAEDRAIGKPPDRFTLRARQGTITLVRKAEAFDPRRALLVIPPGQSIRIYEPYCDVAEAREVSGSGGQVYELPGGKLLPPANQ